MRNIGGSSKCWIVFAASQRKSWLEHMPGFPFREKTSTYINRTNQCSNAKFMWVNRGKAVETKQNILLKTRVVPKLFVLVIVLDMFVSLFWRLWCTCSLPTRCHRPNTCWALKRGLKMTSSANITLSCGVKQHCSHKMIKKHWLVVLLRKNHPSVQQATMYNNILTLCEN